MLFWCILRMRWLLSGSILILRSMSVILSDRPSLSLDHCSEPRVFRCFEKEAQTRGSSPSHAPTPLSMRRQQKRSCFFNLMSSQVTSSSPTQRFAQLTAAEAPTAAPPGCRQNASPNCKMLSDIARCSAASIMSLGQLSGKSALWSQSH